MDAAVYASTAFRNCYPCLLHALEIGRVIGNAVALVLGVFGIRAEWAGSAREGFAFCDYRIGRRTFFHPVSHRAQHVKAVECGRAAGAVPHAGDEEHATPGLYFFYAAVF